MTQSLRGGCFRTSIKKIETSLKRLLECGADIKGHVSGISEITALLYNSPPFQQLKRSILAPFYVPEITLTLDKGLV